MDRPQSPIARDNSLIPDGEVDLVPIVLANTNDIQVLFETAANFVQALAGVPLILLVKSDGDFYEGQAATAAASNVVREANVWHSLPVSERTSWHFRAVAATTTIKGKLYTGS